MGRIADLGTLVCVNSLMTGKCIAMKFKRNPIQICLLMACLALAPIAKAERVFQTLCTFFPTNSGPIFPLSRLLEGPDGSFYGTTISGGAYGWGAIFKMSPLGVLTNLYSFTANTNCYPYGGLTWGNDGKLYGTTAARTPNDRVFAITTNGDLTIIATFNGANGNYPLAPLTLGNDGVFYGTTRDGGTYSMGNFFKVTTNGTLTSLFSFHGTNGSAPAFGALIQAEDGNLYGTTTYGGYGGSVINYYPPGNGTIFRIDTNGNLTTLVYFNGTNGSWPQNGLSLGMDKNFYGTTLLGGTSNRGTVFKMTSDGTLTTLYSFDGINGNWPDTLLAQDSDGFLYGTTTATNAIYTYGTVFKITTNGALSTLIHFDGINAMTPATRLITGTDGNIYGTTCDQNRQLTLDGGAGSVFQLYAPPKPPGYNQITGQLLGSGDLQFSFVGNAGAKYALEYATILSPANWLPQATNPADSGGVLVFTNTPDNTTNNFWRIRSVP